VFKLRALGQMAMFFLRFTLLVLYFLFYAKKFVMQAVLTASSSAHPGQHHPFRDN
jgi:hypothetical protein